LEEGRFAGVCVEVEQLFECGQPVAHACAWVVAECDPFEFANIVGALGSWRELAGSDVTAELTDGPIWA
jgi:hypothetical protein